MVRELDILPGVWILPCLRTRPTVFCGDASPFSCFRDESRLWGRLHAVSVVASSENSVRDAGHGTSCSGDSRSIPVFAFLGMLSPYTYGMFTLLGIGGMLAATSAIAVPKLMQFPMFHPSKPFSSLPQSYALAEQYAVTKNHQTQNEDGSLVVY